MKKLLLAIFLVAGVLFATKLFAQEEPSLDMFYGKKDLGGARIGAEYFLNEDVFAGFADFYYLTKSKKSNYAEKWPLYYGVALEGAYAQGKDYHFTGKGDADFNAWWGLLWIEGRIFTQDTGKVRPYFDVGGGIGAGQVIADGGVDLDLDFTKTLNMFRLKAGTGVEIMLSDKYSLDLGVAADGTIGYMGSFFSSSNLTLAGVQATVGISRWSERK